MTKYILIAALLVFVAAPLAADNLLTEVEDVVIKQVETSALIGNIGPAVGLFWPLWPIEKLNVVAGPMGAVGNEAVIGGLGAQTPVSITVLGFELPVDFGFLGGAYNWVSEDIEIAAGLGRVFEVSF